jgi:hypothetical protein
MRTAASAAALSDQPAVSHPALCYQFANGDLRHVMGNSNPAGSLMAALARMQTGLRGMIMRGENTAITSLELEYQW